MNIYLDIETLRSPEEHRLEMLEDVKSNFKAPSGITKGAMAKDLGLDDKEAKFISAGDMKARWEAEMAETKSADVAREKWEKTSFNPEVAPIACICIIIDDQKFSFDLHSSNYSEAAMLNTFHRSVDAFCSKHGEIIHKPLFIGHNLGKFDLPFIWKRSVINGVKPCDGVKWQDGRHDQHFYDTMIAWAGFGKTISADNLAKILRVKGKTEGMDGSKVYDTWQEEPQKVIDYCHDDVAVVKAIHERLTK
jgi:hypothetical protein